MSGFTMISQGMLLEPGAALFLERRLVLHTYVWCCPFTAATSSSSQSHSNNLRGAFLSQPIPFSRPCLWVYPISSATRDFASRTQSECLLVSLTGPLWCSRLSFDKTHWWASQQAFSCAKIHPKSSLSWWVTAAPCLSLRLYSPYQRPLFGALSSHLHTWLLGWSYLVSFHSSPLQLIPYFCV